MLECIVEPTGPDYDLLLTEQLALTRVLLLNRQSRSTINGLTLKIPRDLIHMSATDSVLSRLMKVIEDRRQNPSDESYTTRLLAGGVEKIGGKILEEAAEVVEAAEEEDSAEAHEHLVREAADMVYHLMVMLGYRRVDWSEVEQELSRRFGVSGLDEKASR
jgi:phosphoribosyl-ATP pyrophosphohydrolase